MRQIIGVKVSLACQISKNFGIHEGETIIIVAGYPAGCGATNAMKIIKVE